jgi:pimeloyl-ACP methyl ester carboxylesterase
VTATAEPSQRTDGQPTVVLVHGAFADASSWNSVIERLQRQGYIVVDLANPLRGVAADSAYLASVVDQLDGPVLLVGHSYGGAVISNAATDAANVVGLVYVAAFAPDTDERLGDVAASSTDSVLMTALVQRGYLTGRGTETAPEFLVDPARFREVFAAGSDVVRSMAQRAGAEIVEVEGSHVIMVSQPQAVVDLIVKVARAVSPADR